MDAIAGFIGGGVGYVVPFLAVLTVGVFVDESGHFWVGRLFDTRIETFSIGFGRAIASWQDRKGTRWKIGWVPLGGYVKFWGDEDAVSLPDEDRLARIAQDPDAGRCFHFKPLWQKALIVLAGPLANFVFAVAVFAALYSINGIPRTLAIADTVKEGSAAAEAGVQAGDEIVSIDGEPVTDFHDLQLAAIASDGDPLTLTIRRDGRLIEIVVHPKRAEVTDRFGNKQEIYQIGIGRGENAVFTVEYPGVVSAVTKGVHEVAFFIERTFAFIGGLISGREDTRQLSGPIGIAKASGEWATLGLAALITLGAYLSASIGLLNLFPIPMLDGGHLMFYGIEAVRRKPMGEQAQEVALRIGLALVLSLMLFATWNDLMRIFWS